MLILKLSKKSLQRLFGAFFKLWQLHKKNEIKLEFLSLFTPEKTERVISLTRMVSSP